MKDKVVVIHQPDFMPYLGFFHRLIMSDIYIIFDDVQYVRGSGGLTNRDKIKTKNGEKYINVGIEKTYYKCLINEVKLRKDNEWRERINNLIRENYKKSVYYEEIFPYIESMINYRCETMSEFNINTIKCLCELFGINSIEIKYSSDLQVEGKSNELIINLVKAVGCHTYLSGVGARAYFEPKLYETARIDVIWQEFNHPVYKQQYSGFIPYLSSIDLLLNCGIDKSREILRNI